MPGGILAGLLVLEAYDAAALSDADPDAVAGQVATRPAWRSRRSERGGCSAHCRTSAYGRHSWVSSPTHAGTGIRPGSVPWGELTLDTSSLGE